MTKRVDMTPTDPRTPEEMIAPGPAAGEEIDPAATPEFALEYGPPAPEEGPPLLDDADVERWLERVGRVASWALPTPEDGLDPAAWRFTETEIEELTPPLTRVINRRAAWLRGWIRATDEIEVGFLLLEYLSANLTRVRNAGKPEPEPEPEPDLEPGHPDRGPQNFGLGGE